MPQAPQVYGSKKNHKAQKSVDSLSEAKIKIWSVPDVHWISAKYSSSETQARQYVVKVTPFEKAFMKSMIFL